VFESRIAKEKKAEKAVIKLHRSQMPEKLLP
jgi:hypothetical protein